MSYFITMAFVTALASLFAASLATGEYRSSIKQMKAYREGGEYYKQEKREAEKTQKWLRISVASFFLSPLAGIVVPLALVGMLVYGLVIAVKSATEKVG